MDWGEREGRRGTEGGREDRKWEERGEDEQRSSLDESTPVFAGLSLLSSSLQFRRICIKISLYAAYHLVEKTGKVSNDISPPLACC